MNSLSSIALVGCTGLVGQALCQHLLASGHSLRLLVRSHKPEWLEELEQSSARLVCCQWDGGDAPLPPSHLENCHAVVNLAGAPVADARWTPKRKHILHTSRIETTRSVVSAIAQSPGVQTLVNASGISVYGIDKPLANEESETHGDHFLAELALEWEQEAFRAEQVSDCRVLAVRIGVVLSGKGGPLEKMIPPFLPGFVPLVPLAGGKQAMPWVHVDDVAGMITAALENDNWSGVVNAVAPEHLSNAEFTKLAAAHSGHWYFPLGPPAWLLRFLLGEMSTIITGDIPVESTKTSELGYDWQHKTLSSALRACGFDKA